MKTPILPQYPQERFPGQKRTARNPLFIFLIFCIALNSCGQTEDSPFPAEISTSKTAAHQRVAGTRLYALIPKDYLCLKELARYQKNDRTIQVNDYNGTGYTASKVNFSRQAIEAKGAKIDSYYNFTLNGYEGTYVEGPALAPGETKLIMAFGNDSFVVIVNGICKTADLEGKKEIQEVFKSFYYDETFVADPLELANFEFDKSITGFTYAMTSSGLFMFAENGRSDAQNPTASSIQVQSLPVLSEEAAIQHMQTMSGLYAKNGMQLSDKPFSKMIVNGCTAIIHESGIRYKTEKGILYEAMLLGKNSSCYIACCSYKDTDSYLEKFKKTVATFRLK
jgi:hypothetical protein